MKLTLSIFLALFSLTLLGQNGGLHLGGITGKSDYTADQVIDERFGITMYNPLVRAAGGDSVRMCSGTPCEGYVSDFYKGGALLHKGYYVKGQIRVYKNYYPDGVMERKFAIVDDHKSKLKAFYRDGILKSEVHYTDQQVREWQDFHPNGELEFHEKYGKSYEYVEFRKFFYDDGAPHDIMVFEKKSKKLYIKTEYHRNGQVRLVGNLIYSDTTFDYMKSGDWKQYNEKGKLIQVTSYTMGRSTHVEKYD